MAGEKEPQSRDEREESPVEESPVALDVAENKDAKLTAALAAAQAEFPTIQKTQTAEVRGKEGRAGYTYTYADLGDVLGAVRPVLAKHGLALIQRTTHGENGKVVLITQLRHVGGGTLESDVELGQSSGNPQAFGGALTYLRRYELVTLLGIAAEEDRDAQDVEPQRNGGSREPQLPGWAAAASDQRKREFLEALEPIIGRDRAKGLARATTDTFGLFPDLLVGFAKGLTAHYTSVQQDAAAEAPQPEPEPQPEPVEEPPPGVGEKSPEGPAPASVQKPKLSGSRENREKAMREAGCICTDPLADAGDNDQCPIEGHGIPF